MTATPAPDGWLAYWSAFHKRTCPTLQMACAMESASVTFLACDDIGAIGRFDADERAHLELTHRPGLHGTIVEALKMMQMAMMTSIALDPPPWRAVRALVAPESPDGCPEDAA